ncbi:MAG TPA: GNAT family N-acetyltransferase [Micromonosporaceae bacterium]|nr:GNAT family N-acetyltransferase [Micromonosporaceae bacterium]
MIQLTAEQARTLLGRFVGERPGFDAAAGHVLLTGHGRAWVDRWPDPRTILLTSADNHLLRGEPGAVRAADLAPLVTGFVDAPAEFLPVLREAAQRLTPWPRLVYRQDAPPEPAPPVAGADVRRLTPDDTAAVGGLSEYSAWIHGTWGGPAGMAGSAHAWGAVVEGRLAAVACTFFRGIRHGEIGIITEPPYQRRGLSTACVLGLCADLHAKGLRPSWSTSPDNIASRRVAEKTGFSLVRHDVLYVVNTDVPT